MIQIKRFILFSFWLLILACSDDEPVSVLVNTEISEIQKYIQDTTFKISFSYSVTNRGSNITPSTSVTYFIDPRGDIATIFGLIELKATLIPPIAPNATLRVEETIDITYLTTLLSLNELEITAILDNANELLIPASFKSFQSIKSSFEREVSILNLELDLDPDYFSYGDTVYLSIQGLPRNRRNEVVNQESKIIIEDWEFQSSRNGVINLSLYTVDSLDNFTNNVFIELDDLSDIDLWMKSNTLNKKIFISHKKYDIKD